MTADSPGRLDWILAQVNDWLKFAEAKNGALVAFNGVVLATTATLFADHQTRDPLVSMYLISLWVLVATGLTIAVFSFLPATEIPLLKADERPSEEDNLLFFGHAKKYSANSYLRTVQARYGGQTLEDDRLSRDIASQIVVNSRIAVWKYTCFKVALWATIAGIVTPILAGVVFGLLWIWRMRHGLFG